MSQNPLPCRPQIRNGGLPLAHLFSSTAALLDPQYWIEPPQRAPEHASVDATLLTKAHFDAIMCNMMIALYQEGRLAQCAKHSERTQQVEALGFAALAK
jgi:hypothetical protein